MIINATFASSATAGEEEAAQTAINYLDSHFDVGDNVSFNITFGTKALNGDVGENVRPAALTYSYGQLESALYARDTAPGASAVAQTAAATLPTTDPTNGAGTFGATPAYARMLGLSPAAPTGSDGTVYLNSNLNFTDSSAGGTTGGAIAPGTYDAVGTMEHEITEVLGRDASGGSNGEYTMLDMFRYTAAGGGASVEPPGTAVGQRDEPFQAGYNAGNQSYFSYDGQTVTLPYESPTQVANGGDVGDWGSSIVGDAFGGGVEGVAKLISPTDIDEMEALGFSYVCYAAGTRIRTMHGEVAVEDLAVGDRVVTASGALRPIRWLGHRRLDCSRHPRARAAWPVRIAAHAFGEGRPARDLLVSPAHSICVDVGGGEVLIPAAALVNGTTIVQVEVDTVTYWHVELDAHDIILAENLPAESYLEMGNRGFFLDADAVALHATPDAPAATHAAFCRPFVEQGPLLEAVKARLAKRAAALALGVPRVPASLRRA